METYKEMKDRHQAEVNALPLAFAFSEKQYRDKLAEWQITPEEAKAGAIIGIGNGGFIKASDRELVVSTFERIAEERQAAIEADQDGLTSEEAEALKQNLSKAENERDVYKNMYNELLAKVMNWKST